MRVLNLLVLRANDPDRLARFYGAFGLSFTSEKHGTGPAHQTCRLDNAVLEIYPSRGPNDRSTAIRIGFEVDSIDDILKTMAPDAILMEATATNWGRRAVVRDPEGHKVELLDRSPPAPQRQVPTPL